MKLKQKPARSVSTATAPAPPATPTTSALSWFAQATIILALIPFVGYLWSLSYEVGFCGYFPIPYYLISLAPTLVLSMTIGTVAPFYPIIIGTFFAIVVTPPLMKFAAKNRKRGFATLLFLLIFMSSGTFFDQIYKKQALLPIGHNVVIISESVAIVLYIALGIFLLLKKDKVWWNESPFTANNTEQAGISSLYSPRVSVVVSALLVVMVLGIVGYSRLGKYVAENQEEFPVFPSPPSMNIQSPEVAVLRVYGEYIYAVPFNRNTTKSDASGRKTTEFEKQLVIVKLSDIKTPLSLEKVGLLRVKPVETTPHQPL